jgi:DNA-binding NarL/FixJ family response regulator
MGLVSHTAITLSGRQSTRSEKNVLKVLVVDDDESLRRMLQVGLAYGPSSVEVVGEAANGFEAIDQAANLQPDLIILDQQMPMCSGSQALPEILRVAPAAKVLFFTAFVGASVYQEAFDEISKDFGIKIVAKGDLTELEAAVEEIARAAA